MIKRFGVKNFLSFKEGFNVSFELNANCPEFISNGETLSRVLCFKGANGSGKTNAMKILPLFSKFCCNSFQNKPESPIEIESFFRSNEPTEFYIEFVENDILYSYESKLDRDRVISEILYRTKERKTPLVVRKGNKIVECLKEFAELEIVKLRSNASLISTAHQYEIEKLELFYNFFANTLGNDYSYGIEEWTRGIDDPLRLPALSKVYYNNDKLFNFSKSLMCKCDLGISDIVIEKQKDKDDKDIYVPYFVHSTATGNKQLTYYSISSGTRKLYRDLVYYYISLAMGGLLVMDEFDVNLHPDILPKLLDLFMKPETNPKGAQLLFVTHNAEIMDYMSKYRTYLINKEDNESYGYRMDEIPGTILRNDRSLVAPYRSGKVGGVPRL